LIPASIVENKIKESLNKDFCESLSSQIILQNCKKNHLNLNNLDRDSYIRLVDSIISDYRAINPLGNNNVALKRKELLAAIYVDWSISCKSETKVAQFM
jgi:hypothetical protein